MNIGVIGFQGAVLEHIKIIEDAMDELDLKGEVPWVRDRSQLKNLDGLVIPGGESTTIGKLISKGGLLEEIRDLGKNGLNILGTCAGLILLAKRGGEEITKSEQPLLKLMDMEVERNAFGRQKESFEADINIPSFGNKPFHCVFIRAPAVRKIWGTTEKLAKFKNKIIAVEQDNYLALAFHPELTEDTRVHKYFLRKIT